MAVPSSGTLNQLGLAQECLNGTYGSGSISGRICLETLVTSGQCGSQSETYPAINTNSASHPNTSTPHDICRAPAGALQISYGGSTTAFFVIQYGTGYISSITPCSSDIRFKDNIELLGHSPSGINVYRFDYKNKKRFGDESWIGVLAHEVEHIPNVVEYIGDYQYVN